MVGTPIIPVRRPISLGLIKDRSNHASHSLFTLTIHYDQQLHTAIIQYTSH